MSSSSVDYIPKDQWGLDPVHRAYAKLYIADILQMQPYPGGEDAAYAYRNHPIYRVDILGRVVRVDERATFFQYGVDDGTGVINCSCWKPKITEDEDSIHASKQASGDSSSFAGAVRQNLQEFDRKQMIRLELGDIIHVRGRVKLFRGNREISAAYFNSSSFAGAVRQNLQEFDRKQMIRLELGDIIHVRGRMKLFRGNREISAAYFSDSSSFAGAVRQNLQELDRKQMIRLELGDIIHVRGRMKLFRGNREISAAYFRKVSGDGCVAEIQRMKELPVIHRQVYDVLFKIPSHVRKQIAREKEEQETGLKTQAQLVDAVCSLLPSTVSKQSVSNFYLRELETISELMQCASQPCKEYHLEQTGVTHTAPAKQLRNIFQQAVERLLQEGIVYKHGVIKDRFQVVQGRNSLSTQILQILQDDCQYPKYENGCHVLHIRDRLRNIADFTHITVEAVHLAMDWLEEQSDVISTTEKHYIALT
ncbi:CST complex subunit STN1-like [Amphiura filiformis]|uniref:CST complex subunit STN1-like n=1 Tax=Amphiura filiformis TaxID=82378 RepID=UPI003B2232FA